MSELNLMLLAFCSMTFLFLSVALLVLLVRNQKQQVGLIQNLLKNQLVENQKLRNLLLAPDVPTLNGLNLATQVPQSREPFTEPDALDEDLTNLGETINLEEDLAKRGYSLGDLGYDLSAAGWSAPIIKHGEEPSAYES